MFSTAIAVAQDISIDELIATAKGDDSVASGRAALELGRCQPIERKVIDVLIELLSDNRSAEHVPTGVPVPEPTVGERAAEALGFIGKPAIEPLCALLTNDMKTSVRRDQTRDQSLIRMRLAMNTLARMGKEAEDSLPALTEVFKSESEQLRLTAVETINSVSADSVRLRMELMGLLADPSADVQSAVIRTVATMGEKALPVVPRLIELLDDPVDRTEWCAPDAAGSRPLRADAALALGEIGPSASAALPRLRTMMTDDNNPLVRTTAAYAIVRIANNDPSAMQCLLRSLQDKKNGTRVPRAAAEFLGQLGPQATAALPILAELVRAPSGSDRSVVATAIGLIDPKSVETNLPPFQYDEDVLVRLVVIEGLRNGRADSEKVVSCFILALFDTEDFLFSPDVRRTAAEGLGHLGARASRAIPSLDRVAKEDEDESVREAATKAANEIRNAR